MSAASTLLGSAKSGSPVQAAARRFAVRSWSRPVLVAIAVIGLWYFVHRRTLDDAAPFILRRTTS